VLLWRTEQEPLALAPPSSLRTSATHATLPANYRQPGRPGSRHWPSTTTSSIPTPTRIRGGLRSLRLLHPEGLNPGADSRGQERPAADARVHPAHRRRSAPSTTARPRWTPCSAGSPTS
jgi:hypothetical protein